MCPSNIFKGLIISLVLCSLLSTRQKNAQASPTHTRQSETHLRPNSVRFSRVVPQPQFSRVRQEPITDFLGDDDDLFDMIKRQSDDYGHMRFGKREFDDYGHMRFGKSVSEN